MLVFCDLLTEHSTFFCAPALIDMLKTECEMCVSME